MVVRAWWLAGMALLSACGPAAEPVSVSEPVTEPVVAAASQAPLAPPEHDTPAAALLQDTDAGLETPIPASAMGEDTPLWEADTPPVRVETRHFIHGTTGLPDHYVTVRAMGDEVVVLGLELNRGHCPYSETHRVDNGVDWPQTLYFGQRKQVRAKCDTVLEASVQTQFGVWTFAFE